MPRLRSFSAAAIAIAIALAPACAGRGDDDGDGDGSGDGDGGGDHGPDADTGGLPRYSLLVQGEVFPALVIEIDAVPGMESREETDEGLVDLLPDLIEKPDGVSAARDGAIASRGADHEWTFDELDELAADTFDLDTPTDTIKIHMMYIDGHSELDGDGGVILGLAWSHTHLAMFKQTIEDNCAGVPVLLRDEVCAAAELSIATHEVGHLLGLVDNGLPMVEDHRDPDEAHGRHDASDACVMYYAYEGEALFDTLIEQISGGGSGDIGFDDACLADLAAERAR
jgi:hypothetical protein